MVDQLIGAGLIAGGAAGALLLIRSALERNPTAAAMASLLLLAAAAGALIVGSWSAPAPAQDRLELLEFALMMAAGPLAAFLIAGLLRVQLRLLLLISPAAVAFAAVLLLTVRYGGDPIIYAVPIQLLYVAYAWTLLGRGTQVRDRRHRAYRQRVVALAILVAFSLTIAASVARLLFSGLTLLRPIVPLTISLLFLVLLGGSLWMLMRRGTALLSVSAKAAGGEHRTVAAAADLILSKQLFRQPDLTVGSVADALGVPPSELSAALSRSEWGSFAAMLQEIRLHSVREMLRSPEEQSTSIEAVGMLCGFRSRSALYETFQRKLGVTPGEYRRRSCPER
ncbi:MAG: helix-turn-helix transcriptional regulator [Sphingomicrobium sp.]